MKRQGGKFTKKDKRISKKENKNKNKRVEDMNDEILSEESDDHEFAEKSWNDKFEKYQTPEQAKRRLAKDILSKLQNNKNKKLEDDFFILDDNDEQLREDSKKNEEDYDQKMAEKLKLDHLRKQNKLYEEYHDTYNNYEIGDAVEYKGHTKCITAFQLTSSHIFSCSKDRSIIKWDRQTQKKDFISWGKELDHHRSDILSLSLHSNENVLVTAGEDFLIKLWDTRNNQLIQTLKGHKNHVNGVKFGINSNNLCSISSDLTFKHWDFAQRGLIETFYEHNAQVLDIDCFNGSDFLTSGNDHQIIMWKTENETKVVFKGHDYAIDRVRSINHEKFVSACQDGSINLWFARRNKPVFKYPLAHEKGWISAMDNLKQTNVFATAGIDHRVKLWSIEGELKGINLMKEIPVNGIVTDLKIREDCIGVTECDELRLGRWITDKCRNKIKIFPLSKPSN